ncbi:choice-of-anchor P family protein [Streptomyces sp. 7N604]|uniref:choice-of-anchor P family protein n=1 Tax=Streptomyces sp. 7N604 TaxID=3457415 RepID=UPI003FD1A511
MRLTGWAGVRNGIRVAGGSSRRGRRFRRFVPLGLAAVLMAASMAAMEPAAPAATPTAPTAPTAPASPAADGEELRVLHWNIWGVTGNHGTHEVVDRLIDRVEGLRDDRLPVHLLSINETCREQVTYVRDQLKSRLGTDAVRVHFAESSSDWRCNGAGSNNDTGVGLIAIGADRVLDKVRYWFDANGGLYGKAWGGDTFTPPDKRAATCMSVSFRSTLGRDVWACSAHLATGSEGPAEKQADTLAKEIKKDSRGRYPMVLAGDLNLTPDRFRAIYAPDQGGHGEFLEVDWPENRWTWGKSSEPTTKLDYIFGEERHLTPTSARLFDGGKCRKWWAYGRCSDHYMLFGTLAFRDGGGGGGGGGAGGGGQSPTRLVYTGPKEARYHDPFTASATLTRSPAPGSEPTEPVSGAPVSFTLGAGGGTQACAATTNASGVARCRLTPDQRPGRTTLTVRYAGDGYAPSTVTVPFTITRQKTAVTYRGPERVANGIPARLSGVLREKSDSGSPIAGRRLTLALGYGEHRQSCTASTDSSGTARCTIPSVDQPLNDDATVPVSVKFDGDAFYRPSNSAAVVLLEYYTGRAYGMTGGIDLPLLPITVAPTPDTGPVRTAHAFRATTPCTARVDATLLMAGGLCPKVTTTLAPGTSTASSTVEKTAIRGVPGLPAIEISGATATSTSTCAAGGSATGTTDVTLRVGNAPVSVRTEPNSEIEIQRGARLTVNEQIPVPGAEHGMTVNAVHLTALDGLVDIVVASATSDVHNCAN